MTIMVVIIAIILVGGLIYSFRVGRAVDVAKSDYDEEIHANVRRNPVLLNPVFLAYIIGIGAALIYIVYHVIR